MVKNSGKQEKKAEVVKIAKGKLEEDVDELFRHPLAEFIDARNKLAAQLKRAGRANDANLVKALAKPSITAWAVNQLYWDHQEAFDELLTAGERFRQAQKSSLAGKVEDMRESLVARRDALAQLSNLATSILQDAGHNPTPDTIHRITTTLEAVSAYASPSDGPTLGRLTRDVDPPGFESLGSFTPGVFGAQPARKAAAPPKKSVDVSTTTRVKTAKATAEQKVRQLEKTRNARIATAKVSLQSARKSLADARSRSQQLEAAHKKAATEVKQVEKQLREAEERFKKAKIAAEAASQHSRNVASEKADALHALETAKQDVDRASKELELLFRESPD